MWWEERREKTIKNHHESDFTQFPSHQISPSPFQDCWRKIWGFGSETKSLAFIVEAVSRVSSFSCSVSPVCTVMNEPNHAYICNRLCWKEKKAIYKRPQYFMKNWKQSCLSLATQVNKPANCFSRRYLSFNLFTTKTFLKR